MREWTADALAGRSQRQLDFANQHDPRPDRAGKPAHKERSSMTFSDHTRAIRYFSNTEHRALRWLRPGARQRPAEAVEQVQDQHYLEPPRVPRRWSSAITR